MSKKIIIILCICISFACNIYGTDIYEVSNELQLNEIVKELEEYTKDLDLESMSKDLLSGKGVNIGNAKDSIFNTIKSSISSSMKNLSFILIFLVVLSIIKSLELEKDSSITKTVNIVGILITIITFLSIYTEILNLMKKTIELEIGIVQIASPFMMGILILTGAITTTSLLEPLMLLLVSAMGFCINYVILPLISISIIFNIITNISESINLKSFSSSFNKTALWINGIFLAIFLAVVGIQTTVSTSVDNITLKTTQAAISGVVPVVRQICIG